MLLSRETCDAETVCGLKYAWLEDGEFRKKSTQEWRTLVGETFHTLEAEGDHFDMFAAKHVSILLAAVKCVPANVFLVGLFVAQAGHGL